MKLNIHASAPFVIFTGFSGGNELIKVRVYNNGRVRVDYYPLVT